MIMRRLYYPNIGNHIGETVTILPRLGPGESRDTEPGAQPWTAVLVGCARGKAIIDQGSGYKLRMIDIDCICLNR